MKIKLIAVGEKMPAWVTQAYQEYSKRLPRELTLQLIEIPLHKRSKTTNLLQLQQKEGEQMLAAIPSQDYVVALDVQGKTWSTTELSQQLQQWMQQASNVSLLVGGPEGLADNCWPRVQSRWSLSPLTFPHPLVRIIVAEQIYRAWSILSNHPYHRA
jgi:23S rRNA (pseudouridine1915-N3)-methyltransferase